MMKLVIFLLAVACALSDSKPEGSPRFFIAGGTDTTISSHPWQVSIQYNGVHFCGGSIYNNKIIVTAAHCLKNMDASLLKVRVGATKWNSGGILIQVAAFKMHENYYVFSTAGYDIGVIRLNSSVEYSSTVKNIDLASSSPDNGATAEATGWGFTKSTNQISEILQHVNVKIVGRSQCSSSYGYEGPDIKPSMICAFAPGKGICQGDSGGPLVSGGVLVGVTSSLVDCIKAKYPDVYADVAYLRSWIISAASSV